MTRREKTALIVELVFWPGLCLVALVVAAMARLIQ